MSGALALKVARLPHAAGLPLPAYRSSAAAGMDLVAAVPDGKPRPIVAGERALIETGLVVAIPVGYEGQVRPRSGLALSHGLTVLNAPGTIDADYRGEVKVLLVNLGSDTVLVERGMRIAQLVVAGFAAATLVEVAAGDMDDTERGAGGFGSTGSAA